MKDAKDPSIYVIDTSTLIEFSVWLPLPLNKVFWTKIEDALRDGKWVLLDTMVDEIRNENDGLKAWCKEQKRKGLVKNIDDGHRNRAIEINNLYKMIDDTTARSTGDTYLIAYAEAHKLTIFTREKPRKNSADLFKIPDVCDALKIKYIRRPRIFLEAIWFKN